MLAAVKYLNMRMKEDKTSYTLTLSDERFYVQVNKLFNTATLMRSDRFEEICELDCNLSDQQIINAAESEYILRNLQNK